MLRFLAALIPGSLILSPVAADGTWQEVAPIFERYCSDCHGPETQESGIRLDRRAQLLRGGDSGEPAIIPGKAKSSHLIALVSGENPAEVMPPEGDRLTADQIATIAEWIDGGALMPQELSGATKIETTHWSFQPIVRPKTGPGHPIDRLVQARLKQEELSSSPRADEGTLIRRLFLVMHGIPPTPDQVAQWALRLKADFADQWPKLVDEVLASPRYGERWARHWLDIIRFGETHGFETNRERPNAWPFRDYVIDSFNEDKPWDLFMKEQIAGDAMNAPIATGFLVAGPHDIVKSTDRNLTLMQRQDELSDLINVTGTAFMGLTLGCARCHNHKFDPITQRDFYSIQAVFAGVQHADRSLPRTNAQDIKLAEATKKVAKLRALLTEFIPQVTRDRILLDDVQIKDAGIRGVRHLATPEGAGTNPNGNGKGQKGDAGDEYRSANLSGGTYSWWQNTPGQHMMAWQPVTRGSYRIWLSWGCGFETHTTDARYILDHDGDTSTTDDQVPLATVNQQQFADGSEPTGNQPLWSGFRDAGVHKLNPKSIVLLQGGTTGTAVTGDVLLFESADEGEKSGSRPSIRPAVSALHNIERIQPVDAKFVRMTIRRSSRSEVCLDELEVFSGKRNVALASAGTIPTASGTLPGYEIHKLKHVNDGKFGNPRSWISNSSGESWVMLEFPDVERIDRIEWARDRDGRYSDRVAVDYVFEASLNGSSWRTIASSRDRAPFSEQATSEPSYDFASAPNDRAALGRKWLADLKTQQGAVARYSKTQAVYAGTFQQPGPTYRLFRGDPLSPREAVPPDALEVLGTLAMAGDTPEQQRRIKFADWLASKGNPLPARVIVNRLWQHHFGNGIVATPNDFGRNGVPPTHPQLLDLLADELTQNGWSLKHMHRLILSSHTWTQSSQPTRIGLAKDAGTSLLWRFAPRRLEAEAIRDSILSASGVLNLQMGGPGFSGFEVQMENVRHFFPRTSFGPAEFRRMVYMTKVRQEQEAVFGAFDCPDASQVISRRSRSTTPLQALNLMNSIFVTQQADLFAQRLQKEAATLPAQINRAIELCYNRKSDPGELEDCQEFAKEHGLPALCRAFFNSSEFLFVP